jgi:hypothetical protein
LCVTLWDLWKSFRMASNDRDERKEKKRKKVWEWKRAKRFEMIG